jgi:hypothetical protein
MGADESGERLHVALTSEPYITEGARRTARRLAWSLVVLFVITAVIGAANLIYTTQRVNAASRADSSSCRFFADLAGLPITVSPSTHTATLLGVEIISDAREAWHGRGCPGTLPPPSASFRHWAAYYRLPIG